MAAVPVDSVLDVDGFDPLSRLESAPAIREREYPFAWAGLYVCGAGEYLLELTPGPTPSLSVTILRVDDQETKAFHEASERAVRLFSTGAVDRAGGQVVLCGDVHQRLVLKRRESTRFRVPLPRSGRYVLFTEFLPEAFDLRLVGPVLVGQHHFAPLPAEEDAVKCVRLTVERPLHAAKFQRWLERLLRDRGPDLLRIKGWLNLAGTEDRMVIQGVRGVTDLRVLEPWGDRSRATHLVLSGRNLPQRVLFATLQACST
jgi:G3E family GTPase